MKKILVSVIGMMTLFVSSCSDMLDVDSGREVDVPELNQASDSLFYVLGIMQAMQQAGDAYVLQNELRGDLASLTSYADVDMQQLTFFDTVKDDDIIRELGELEINNMSPMDALNTLYRLQNKLKNRWKE